MKRSSNAALIHKSGGGTGFSFSRLRPQGQRRSTPPAAWPVGPDQLYEGVQHGHRGRQAGRHPPGRQHGHPAGGPSRISWSLSTARRTTTRSPTSTSPWASPKHSWRRSEGRGLRPDGPQHQGRVAGQLNAREVFDKIVDAAWRNGEPGIIFLDRLNRDNVVPSQGEIEIHQPLRRAAPAAL